MKPPSWRRYATKCHLPTPTVVVFFFYLTLTLRFRAYPACCEQKRAHDRFSTFNPSELCAGIQGKVGMGSARAFQIATEITSPAAGTPLDILVAEHHPLQSRDQALIDAAAKLACDGQLCFHFSIDDPVMKHFGSDTIKALYERLGIPKDECISHALVTTAICAAQEKIESRVGKDVTTHSGEDWFNYNMIIKQ